MSVTTGKHTMQSLARRLLSIAAVLLLWASLAIQSQIARAEDWPTYRHDNRRSGVTSESLNAAALKERWVYRAAVPPRPAWPGPAKWDAYATVKPLRSMRDYDPVYYTIVVGNDLYFSSSAEDSVFCLDTASGAEKWSYCADGPVRIAPAWYGGNLYFGSDDGYVYCVKAADGALVWKARPGPEDTLLPCDGRFISRWPVRTGVLIAEGKAYFGASLLPWQSSYLCGVDAARGAMEGPGLYRRIIENTMTLEGALLASATRLYVPQGRIPPAVFDLATGEPLGSFEGGGGAFALITPDSKFLHGPGNKAGWITESAAETGDKMAQYEGGTAIVVTEDVSYLLSENALAAASRKDRKALWKVACDCPNTLILAGKTLFAGGSGRVAALDTATGEEVWSGKAEGQVHGLTAANGALFVSASSGAIHCFKDTNE